MFRVMPKGFQIEFENGYLVSIQFGLDNYCENRQGGRTYSQDAEVAVFWPEGSPAAIGAAAHYGFYPLDRYDDVKGWVPAADVATLLWRVGSLTGCVGGDGCGEVCDAHWVPTGDRMDEQSRDPLGLLEGLGGEEHTELEGGEDDGAVGVPA